MMSGQGNTNHEQNARKYGKKFVNMKAITKQSVSSLTWLNQLWSLPGDTRRKSEHVAVKFVPQFLRLNQKPWYLDMKPEFHEMANNDPPFISRIITGMKSGFMATVWRQQSSQQRRPQSPRLKKGGGLECNKSMLITFQRQGHWLPRIWSSQKYDELQLLL